MEKSGKANNDPSKKRLSLLHYLHTYVYKNMPVDVDDEAVYRRDMSKSIASSMQPKTDKKHIHDNSSTFHSYVFIGLPGDCN